MDKYVVRQAIKDGKTNKIIGYDILFQSDNDSLYNSSESQAADTISRFLMQNNETIFNDNLTFLTFPPTLFFRNTPKMFDNSRMVIQIEANIVVHPLAQPMIKRYRQEGYAFAIDDFQFAPKYFTMLELMDYVKITLKGKNDDQGKLSLDNMVKMLHGLNKKCIAVGVNSKEDYELAKEIGADLLEGNYIEETKVTKVNKAEYMQGSFLQLVVAVGQDEPNIDEIEQIISRDATLSYSILKIANSAYFAMRKRISSIRQAIVTLGISQLRHWVYLLSFNEEKHGDVYAEILKRSFLRATFASALTEKTKDFPLTHSETYMMGMFSTMDLLIDASLDEILQDIPVADEVKNALIHKEGPAGKLYQLILDYEKADWRSIKILSKELELPANAIAQTYMDCVEEVNEIWKGLSSEYERPEGENEDTDEAQDMAAQEIEAEEQFKPEQMENE